MDTEKNKKNPLFIICAVVLAAAVIITAAASAAVMRYAGAKRHYTDFGADWVYENGEAAQLDKLSESCVIHKNIPYIEADATLSFNARNLDVDIYIDGDCVYRTEKTDDSFLKAFFGKTAGSAFVEVPISEKCSGRTLYIHVINPYKNGSACKIVNMYFGSGVSIVKHNASTQLGSFCFSIMILFIGVVCIIVYIPMSRHNMIDRGMLYLGMTAFVFGMLMMTDSKMLHLIVGHETLYYTVSQMFMTAAPIPMLLFFDKLYENLNRKLITALCLASAVDFAAVLILNVFGIIDYHDNAFPVLIIFAVSIVYIGYVTAVRMIKRESDSFFHNIGVIILAVSAVLDLFMTRVDIFVETSFFTRFGIAGFTAMECVQVLWKHIENYQKGVKAQLVSRLAYHDGLTDMLNRTSFMEDAEKLEKETSGNVLIAVFDVNGLKYVNDNFGHSDGDELIINVADTLGDCFGKMGKCYRVGGDEFILISTEEEPESKFAEACESMNKRLAEISKGSKYPVSVAAGCAVMNGGKRTVKELLDEADEKMYGNKREMKEKAGFAAV